MWTSNGRSCQDLWKAFSEDKLLELLELLELVPSVFDLIFSQDIGSSCQDLW
jgi:hypothetical protein